MSRGAVITSLSERAYHMMNEKVANEVASEVKALYPHVKTIIVPSKNHFLIGVYIDKEVVDFPMFSILSLSDWELIKKALAVLVPAGFSFSTYEELQRARRCSCGAQGAQFPDDGTKPDDVAIFVCTNAHAYFVERRFLEDIDAGDVVLRNLREYRAFLDSVEGDEEYEASREAASRPKAEEI